ncbi:DUF2238 domain-containing protein [Viridibacterium curvum]|uniref:DUF2238 domain-containing protein n=1 Tax=Viridibacterium curvum TaxID=1101404 RepID=A0ABP9QT88_9RHOO
MSDNIPSLRLPVALTVLVLAALALSGLNPYDRLTWALEVVPVLIVLPWTWAGARRFPLTPLLQVLLAVHAIVLIAGGAWSYARVPFGFWLQDVFDLSRNPYDKIGHFLQGVTPALFMREHLLRSERVRGAGLAAVLSVSVALAFSAIYELIEWISALLLGQGADEFLGTQGDVWDTQSDMAMALLGAVLALTLIRRRWTAA